MVDHDELESATLFHEGEIALQRSVGMAERLEYVGPKIIRDFMPDQHREFFAHLPFLVAATVDPSGDVWPTMLAGQPGFLQSPTPASLTINAQPYPGDPAAAGLSAGGAIGLLGIEPHSRRRNRMNGIIRAASEGQTEVEVVHSFGNCPKYIHRRELAFSRRPKVTPERAPQEIDAIDDAARKLITTADTFFVASYVDRDEGRQIDVSHRGGSAGFVRLDGEGTLTIPDYSGNFFFNTLGNFVVNPRAGLIFVDFSNGDLLQLAGLAEVLIKSPEIADFEGALRIWKFRPHRIFRRPGALPMCTLPEQTELD